MDKFNLTDYFHQGYTKTRVDLKYADRALELMRAQEYVTRDYKTHLGKQLIASSWGVDPLSPTWDLKSHMNATPDEIQELAGDLAQSGYYDWFTGIYGHYTQRTVMGTKYEYGQSLGWHVECCLGTFNANYLVLTGDQFEDSDGGQIEVGICDSDSNGDPIEGSDLELEKIPVTHGTLVTVYNINPNTIRRVKPLVTGKELYILHFYFGYLENTINRAK